MEMKTFAKTKKKRVLKIIGIVLAAIAAVVVIYVLYVVLSYYRISDNQVLEPEGNAELETLEVGEEYTIVTQNCGFGAYLPEFTFFMDG